jgi:hypothetical protein
MPFQEGSNILLGRLDEQFSVRVSAHVLSEEIKAMLHVRNDCFRRREFKTGRNCVTRVIQVEVKDATDVSDGDICTHLMHIAQVFENGDFDIPMFVHDTVPQECRK